MFKVVIVGGENRGDYKLFANKCVQILKNKVKDGITIFSVGDKFVDIFSKATNIDVVNFCTNWSMNGKNALKVRNNEMIEKCDAAIIFDDGTKDTRTFASMIKEKNKPYRLIQI